MNGCIDKSIKEIEKLSGEDRKIFFDSLKDYCSNKRKCKTNITITQRAVAKIGKKSRKFQLIIRGRENIPVENCLLLCNHSNTHDAFVLAETLTELNKPCTFLAARDGLSPIEALFFRSARATMFNRANKASAQSGLYDFAGKIIHGDTGVIFGESTWNLHPYKPKQKIKIGCVKVAAIVNKPIVPIIIEYVEVPYVCSKENELYDKCIVQIGKPISIDCKDSLIGQLKELQTVMEEMRIKIKKEVGSFKTCIEEVNPYVYVNHTRLKKYGPLFTFDSARENSYLYSEKGEAPENEYHINEQGVFQPGLISRKKTI